MMQFLLVTSKGMAHFSYIAVYVDHSDLGSLGYFE